MRAWTRILSAAITKITYIAPPFIVGMLDFSKPEGSSYAVGTQSVGIGMN